MKTFSRKDSMEKKIIPELFIKPNESFKYHLSINENHRILFSGRFGIGKTTFLNHYFKDTNEEYNVIHLYPVNYSLLENEDIFSYVKYDILISLFSNDNYPLKPEYYDFLKTWDTFMLDNLGQVIATTMLLIPKMGKQLNQFAKELKQMNSDFKKFSKSEKQNEMNEINSFLSKFHNSEGGIYESNVITLIIQEWLKDIEFKGKKNILIIDDLDRIDPTHIFRLLNVFSAHFDNKSQNESQNKFGFSQIVLVCDAENIRYIYQNQFGQKTDFNGYIDKFYSKEIYRFDNRENILSILKKIVDSIKIGGYLGDGIYVEEHPDSKMFKEYIIILLKPLISNNSINLRSLFKFYAQTIQISRNTYKIDGEDWFPIENCFLLSIYVISQFIGDFDFLKRQIKKLPNLIIGYEENPFLFIGNLIMLMDSKNSSKLRTGLWGQKSNSLNYDFELNPGKTYKCQYSIFPPQQNKKTYSGFLENLEVNGKVIDKNFQNSNKIDVNDLIIYLIDKIIV